MKINQAAIANNALPIAGGIVLIIAAVYYLLRKTVSDAAGAVTDTAAGIISGNNAVTEGTPYAGAGVLGTLGGATNAALGGVPQAIGETISSWFAPTLSGDAANMLDYSVLFPDGIRHAVPSNRVDKTGRFVNRNLSANYAGDGYTYRIGFNQSNQRVAVRV